MIHGLDWFCGGFRTGLMPGYSKSSCHSGRATLSWFQVLNGSMAPGMFLRRLTGLLPVVVPPVFLSVASRTSNFCFILLFAASSFRELFLCLPAGFLAGSFWLQLRFELWKNSKTQYKIQNMEDWHSC
jgi:hypothetical protein